MKKWYEIKALKSSSAEITIYEEIGLWGITAKQFSKDLKALGELKDISVRLNSGGGSVFDGAAIYNLLKQHSASVTVYIDGLAASIASVIAMAGDKVIMADNALMMIHDPWSLVVGSADDMRQEADLLDKVKESLVTTYEARTGMTRDEISAMMKDETWLDAEEAIAFGFADERADAFLAAAKIRDVVARYEFEKAPVIPTEANIVAQGNTEPNSPVEGQTPLQDKGDIIMPENNIDLDQIKKDGAAEALAADKQRRNQIKDVFSAFPDKAELMRQCQDDDACDVVKAQAALLKELGSGDAPTATVGVVRDSADKFREGASAALFARTGFGKHDSQNEYRGCTLLDLARMSLERNGQSTERMNRMDIAAAAFTHSTSDFGSILSNVANKSMLKGWEEAQEVFEQFTAKGSLPDFKSATRVDLGAFPSLRQVRPGAEFKHVTLSDRAETIQLATYGELFSINRQAIINDDLGLFSTIPSRFGRAAKRTVGDLVFAILTGNPTMSDSVVLFHADHSNLLTAAAPTTAAFDAARTAMAKQTDPDGNVVALNIRPRYVIVPVALEGAAKVVVDSETEIASNQNNSKRPNSVRNMVDVISDARLDAVSATNYYFAADPGMFDTIEVAYLDGMDQPFLDQMTGWTIDGTEFKVRIDAGVKALDYRGLLKNPYTV